MRPLPALLLAAAAGAAALAASLRDDDPAAGMARYWAGLLYRGESAQATSAEQTRELMAGHLARIEELVASGEMVLAGPFEGDGELRGLFIYDVESEQRARELADSDPAVAAGRLRVELLPWWGPARLKTLLDEPADPRADGDTDGAAREGGARGERGAAHDDSSSGGEAGAAVPDADTSDEAAAPRTSLEDEVVETACGQCQLGLPGDGCDLAVRFDGRAFFVRGTTIDDHGDAHAADGLCNAVRRARVSGKLEDGRFLATSFELLPED